MRKHHHPRPLSFEQHLHLQGDKIPMQLLTDEWHNIEIAFVQVNEKGGALNPYPDASLFRSLSTNKVISIRFVD